MMTPIEYALNEILAMAEQQPSRPVSERPLVEVLGMRLAQSIHSEVMVPPKDNSAMDGYALRCTDIADPLSISQQIPAGVAPEPLQPGSAARILTGAELPDGADVVVMQESCDLVDACADVVDGSSSDVENRVKVRAPEKVKVGENIRRAGQDIAIGEEALSAGVRLSAVQLGVAASIGLTHLPVLEPLKIGILSTGRELIEPGEPLPPGAIYNSNRFLLMGLIKQLGHQFIDFGVVPDTLEATVSRMQQAAQQADLVISTGGVSVGDEDHVKAALDRVGQITMWKLAIKPGKPLLFGSIEGMGDKRIPFFGLPGNPSAVLVTFLMVVRPFIMKWQGIEPHYDQIEPLKLPIDFEVKKVKRRQEYIRVCCRTVNDDNTGVKTVLEAHPNQSSGMLSSASWADGLAVIPIGVTLQRGDSVDFYSFDKLLNQ